MLNLKYGRDAGEFLSDDSGAALVEYAVALIVVTLIGGVIFALGNDIAVIIGASAGAF